LSRLDVRCEVNLPVTVSFQKNGSGTTEVKRKFSNLSLGGGLILSKPPYPPKKILNLRYNLPTHGEMKVCGEIIRYESSGIVTRFLDINKEDKMKLWEYLRENVTYTYSCPYCRNENISNVSKCKTCGLNLNFNSPDYIVKHERELFMKRITMKSDFFSFEDISRILHFVDVEILGIGGKQFVEYESAESGKIPSDSNSRTFYKELSGSTSLKEAMRLIEKQKLIEALMKYNNNITKVAKVLEVSRPIVYSMMKKYGIRN